METSFGETSLLPYLPLQLAYQGCQVEVSGLLDTGATVNVLPYSVGQQLGVVWEEQKIPLQLTGNLNELEARALILSGTVDSFPTVRLVFAWTQVDDVPVLLGQTNFFLEFDVCFYRLKSYFEVRPADKS